MTNDHDADLLASTYLDGQATDEERARAEGDPDVMDRVERFRSLRAELLALDTPDEERREVTILAALDARPASSERAGDVVTAPTPLPMAHRGDRRMTSLLTGAAAALVAIAVAGIIVVVGRGGGDEDSADAPTARDASSADTEFGGDLVLDTMAAGGAATDAMESADEAAPAATEAAASTLAETTMADSRQSEAEATTSGTGASDATAAATAAALTVVRSGAELYEFAIDPLTPRDDTAPPTCTPAGDASFVGTASFVAGSTATVVEVFLGDQTARAFDVVTCDLVATAGP